MKIREKMSGLKENALEIAYGLTMLAAIVVGFAVIEFNTLRAKAVAFKDRVVSRFKGEEEFNCDDPLELLFFELSEDEADFIAARDEMIERLSRAFDDQTLTMLTDGVTVSNEHTIEPPLDGEQLKRIMDELGPVKPVPPIRVSEYVPEDSGITLIPATKDIYFDYSPIPEFMVAHPNTVKRLLAEAGITMDREPYHGDTFYLGDRFPLLATYDQNYPPERPDTLFGHQHNASPWTVGIDFAREPGGETAFSVPSGSLGESPEKLGPIPPGQVIWVGPDEADVEKPEGDQS